MRQSEFVDRIISKRIEDEELRELLIAHSTMVGRKALAIADALPGGEIEDLSGIDRQFLYDAAMLHDIGIVECDAPSIHCHGTLPYICHGIAGAEILRREGLDERYARVCERHTGAGITARDIEEQRLPLETRDYLPETIEEKIICVADKFYSKSGDPRHEKTLEQVLASLRRHGEEPARRMEALLRDVGM